MENKEFCYGKQGVLLWKSKNFAMEVQLLLRCKELCYGRAKNSVLEVHRTAEVQEIQL